MALATFIASPPMKGVYMKKLQSVIGAILDKVDNLLTTEPARLIGYGAAVVVYLAARFLADRGYLNLPLTFDQSVTAAFGAITTLVIIVESIRRFVYSPMTYIEDISDESQAAHQAAHVEEAFRSALDTLRQPPQAEAPAPEAPKVVVVGSVLPDGSKDLSN